MYKHISIFRLNECRKISKMYILLAVIKNKMLLGNYWQLWGIYFVKRTFTRHAVATQVVANSAGAATGVLGSGEAEL